jgi:hypothetical protein
MSTPLPDYLPKTFRTKFIKPESFVNTLKGGIGVLCG